MHLVSSDAYNRLSKLADAYTTSSGNLNSNTNTITYNGFLPQKGSSTTDPSFQQRRVQTQTVSNARSMEGEDQVPVESPTPMEVDGPARHESTPHNLQDSTESRKNIKKASKNISKKSSNIRRPGTVGVSPNTTEMSTQMTQPLSNSTDTQTLQPHMTSTGTQSRQPETPPSASQSVSEKEIKSQKKPEPPRGVKKHKIDSPQSQPPVPSLPVLPKKKTVKFSDLKKNIIPKMDLKQDQKVPRVPNKRKSDTRRSTGTYKKNIPEVSDVPTSVKVNKDLIVQFPPSSQHLDVDRAPQTVTNVRNPKRKTGDRASHFSTPIYKKKFKVDIAGKRKSSQRSSRFPELQPKRIKNTYRNGLRIKTPAELNREWDSSDEE